jgi:hypothetical protein
VDAIGTAVVAAERFGPRVSAPVVLRDTNNVVVWLAPEPVVAKVGREPTLSRERRIATALADAGAPVVAPAPGLPLDVHTEAGYPMTFWTYVPPPSGPHRSAPVLASALADLHQHLDWLPASTLGALPRFTDELDESLRILSDPRRAPALADDDRNMLRRVALSCRTSLFGTGSDHVLHGAPHPYNMLTAENSVLFIDFETVCAGPIEWDLAHQPQEVAATYPAAVHLGLLDACRVATSVKTAAFCWADVERGDLREHAEHHTAFLRSLTNDANES